jgi:hypothetical protein
METTDKTTVDEVVSRLQAGAHEVVDKVANATTQAAGALDQKGEQLKNAEQQLLEKYRCYVNENPLTALSIAVGQVFC